MQQLGIPLEWDTDGDGTIEEGEYLTPQLLRVIDEEQYQKAMNTVQTGSNGTINRIDDPGPSSLLMAWEIILLMTGSYFLTVLAIFGVPQIFIIGILMIYWMLLGRFILRIFVQR